MNYGVKSLINYMMIDLLGVPKKYKNNPNEYEGYYRLIGRWQKQRYPLKYIYYCLTLAKDYKYRTKKNVSVGFIIYLLKTKYDEYRSIKDKIKISSIDDLLNSGYSFDMLPTYMLSKAEKRFIDIVKHDKNKENVTKQEVDSLKKMISGL